VFRQVDQRIVSVAARRFTAREVEGEGWALGIADPMNFTSEPAVPLAPMQKLARVASVGRRGSLVGRGYAQAINMHDLFD